MQNAIHAHHHGRPQAQYHGHSETEEMQTQEQTDFEAQLVKSSHVRCQNVCGEIITEDELKEVRSIVCWRTTNEVNLQAHRHGLFTGKAVSISWFWWWQFSPERGLWCLDLGFKIRVRVRKRVRVRVRVRVGLLLRVDQGWGRIEFEWNMYCPCSGWMSIYAAVSCKMGRKMSQKGNTTVLDLGLGRGLGLGLGDSSCWPLASPLRHKEWGVGRRVERRQCVCWWFLSSFFTCLSFHPTPPPTTGGPKTQKNIWSIKKRREGCLFFFWITLLVLSVLS